jgi:UDP-N-acetylmuramoyl-tripeptide--D-alanyl-D-alanine ligase
LITNVGKAHLEGFSSIDGVAQAKGELFEYLMNNQKTLYINQGNPYILKLVKDNYHPVIYYNGEAGLQARNVSSTPFLELVVYNNETTSKIKTKLLGRYNVENILAAFCVGLQNDILISDIVNAIEAFIPMNNRSQLINTGRNSLYMDAYNANPSSMRLAIDDFLAFDDKNKLLILGEMGEVGDKASFEHSKLISYLKTQQVKNVICVGKSFNILASDAGYLYFDSSSELCNYLKATKISDFFILIKGSRGNQLEKIIPHL